MLGKIDLRSAGAESDSAIEGLKKFFLGPHKILIVSHQNPDGDAVGSALGLRDILATLGHEVSIAVPDDSPPFLKWLPGHAGILIFERRSGKRVIESAFRSADLVVCVDFNAPDRADLMEPWLVDSKVPLLLIDHHPPQDIFTDYYWIDETKGSTSELVYYFIKRMGWAQLLSAETATCLLAGIMTDTVEFKVNCSYPEVFETVAELVRAGADKDRIYNEIYSMFSESRMRLLGYSLESSMKILPELHSAYIALTRAELNRFNHRKGDTEGFVNYPLSIEGIQFSVLFTEQEDHIKLSLRSKGTFPVNEFANRFFNGGGHINAAGGRFYGTMPDAIAHFESVLMEYQDLLKKV